MISLEFAMFMGLCACCYLTGIFIYHIRYGNKADKKIEKRVFNKIIIDKINEMDGIEFESFCCYIFSNLGYMARQTQATNDGGKDIVLINKKLQKTYVECKRYASDNLIGRELIQKLVGSAIGDGVINCIFVTTSAFNNNALEYVNNMKGEVDVELIDLDKLLDMVGELNQDLVMRYFNNTMNYLRVVK